MILIHATSNMKYDHPIVAKISELHLKLSRDGNDIVLSWFLAMWVLEEIRLQTLLSMPSMATP